MLLLLVWLDWGRSLQLAGLSETPGPLVPNTRHHCDTTDRQRTAQPDRFIKPHFLQLGFSLCVSLPPFLFSYKKTQRRERVTTALCQRPLCLQGHWLVDVWCASSVVMTNFFLMWPIFRHFFSSSIFCCRVTLWPVLCHLKRQARACGDAYKCEQINCNNECSIAFVRFGFYTPFFVLLWCLFKVFNQTNNSKCYSVI